MDEPSSRSNCSVVDFKEQVCQGVKRFERLHLYVCNTSAGTCYRDVERLHRVKLKCVRWKPIIELDPSRRNHTYLTCGRPRRSMIGPYSLIIKCSTNFETIYLKCPPTVAQDRGMCRAIVFALSFCEEGRR